MRFSSLSDWVFVWITEKPTLAPDRTKIQIFRLKGHKISTKCEGSGEITSLQVGYSIIIHVRSFCAFPERDTGNIKSQRSRIYPYLPTNLL